MTSFPVSSSRDSVSRGTSPASASASGSISTSTARPRNDGPPRLNKEFASYRNIFEEIEAHEKNDLSWRLSRGTARQSRHTQAREGGDGVQEALVDEIDVDVDVEDDIVTEGNNERDSAQLRRKPKRVDGLSFTPSYQSEMHNHSNDAGVSTNQTTLKRKRRKIEKSRSDIDRESMRWPISLTELDNYSSEIDDLEESIKIFIGSYIRHNQLQHPYSRSSSNPASASTSASNADADADPNTSEVMVDETFDFGEMDIEQNIPRNLVRNCTEMVRTVLVNLAILRPSDIGRKRKEMGPIDWVGVLGSASMQKDLTPLVRRADSRLRAMYKADDADLFTHRLNILHPTPAASSKSISTSTPQQKESSILEDLYDTVLPKKDAITRPHQSKAELEKRAEKKRQREESRRRVSGSSQITTDTHGSHRSAAPKRKR